MTDLELELILTNRCSKLAVEVNFNSIPWSMELKATATSLWLVSRVLTDSGSLGLAFSKTTRSRLGSLLMLIDSGLCHVSAINITSILKSWINPTTSSNLLFSDLTFWNPIKTEDPVFWAWWRLETSGISSWRSLLCLAHLSSTFLPALFPSDFCRFQDDLSLIGFPEAKSHWDYCKKINLPFT